MTLPAPLLEVEALGRSFPLRRHLPWQTRRHLLAVTGIDLALAAGETLGLVGESGSGKSTLGRTVAGILPPSEGQVRFAGQPLADPRDTQARRLQLVFQDALGALNYRLTIGRQVAEVLDIHAIAAPAERPGHAVAALAQVGLAAELIIYVDATDEEHVAYGMGDLHLPIGWGSVPYDILPEDLPIRPRCAAILELAGRHEIGLELTLAHVAGLMARLNATAPRG